MLPLYGEWGRFVYPSSGENRRGKVYTKRSKRSTAWRSHRSHTDALLSLFTRLARREGYAFASETKLGEMLGRSDRTVRRQIRQLESYGAIRVERPARTSTNRIFVLVKPDRVRSDVRSTAPTVSARHNETVIPTQETTATPLPSLASSADVLLLVKQGQTDNEQPLPIVAEHVAKALVENLKLHGVGPRVAANLVTEYPHYVIERRLLELPYRHADDPAAMLVASIRENYTEPAAMRADRERLERQIAKDELERDRSDRAAAERTARDTAEAMAAERLARLSEDARQRLDARARADVADRTRDLLRAFTPPFVVERMVAARARELLSGSDDWLSKSTE